MSENPPECSRPLVLADCVRDWRREARHGELDTGRYRCRYFTWGRGPALVFVPGLACGAKSFVMPMHRLRAQFRCVGYDLPAGLGDRARLATYTHDGLRDDLLALLDHLQIRRAYLYGASFGSTVALSALAAAPQRFPRAILQGGFARRPLAQAEVLLAHFARYWPGTLAGLPLVRAILKRNHATPFARRAPDDWRFFCEESTVPAWRTFANRVLLLHRTDLRPLLPCITQPVLLVHGDCDPLVGRAYHDELRRLLPAAASAELEGCGHQPQFTHPEVLAEVVGRFLAPQGFA